MKQLRLFALGLTAVFALFSCSKKDNSNPNGGNNNPPANKVINEAKLKTKWELVSFYNIYYDTTGKAIDANGISQTYQAFEVLWLPEYAGHITYHSDYTYTHSNKDGTDKHPVLSLMSMPSPGSWKLKNSDTVLSMEYGIGSTKTNFDFQVVEFRDNYLHIKYDNPIISSFNRRAYLVIELKR